MRKKILITIICYNNHVEVLDFINMCSSQSLVNDIHVVVSINSISENDFLILRAGVLLSSISVDLHYLDENKGYLNGMILGAEFFLDKYKYLPKWQVMCNTDIVIKDVNFFQSYETQSFDKNTWVVGPSIYDRGTKSYCNPHYINRISYNGMKFRSFIFSNTVIATIYSLLSKVKSSLSKAKKDYKSKYVYSTHGCFFIIDSELTIKLFTNKYGVLMYSEESYIAEIVRQYDKKVFYISDLEVEHIGSTTTSLLGATKKYRYIKESLDYVYKKFYCTFL
ncbi:hypothetical protein [Francisella sp. TX07-6608]|uniref:hypothetical protein n=1 Tax=Francisella sp. TX07-6608 TaxID=573568 RepID=UPI0008F9D8F0|nr:hypothetical protein [Francisella sp. TX07-6608]OIN83883.1 hypothetical protein KX00_633 [Francisella sp. TX07-6608]